MGDCYKDEENLKEAVYKFGFAHRNRTAHIKRLIYAIGRFVFTMVLWYTIFEAVINWHEYGFIQMISGTPTGFSLGEKFVILIMIAVCKEWTAYIYDIDARKYATKIVDEIASNYVGFEYLPKSQAKALLSELYKIANIKPKPYDDVINFLESEKDGDE